MSEDGTGDCGGDGDVALAEVLGGKVGGGFPRVSPALINGTIFLRNFLLRFVTLLLPSILTKYESNSCVSTIFPVFVHLPGCLGAAWS